MEYKLWYCLGVPQYSTLILLTPCRLFFLPLDLLNDGMYHSNIQQMDTNGPKHILCLSHKNLKQNMYVFYLVCHHLQKMRDQNCGSQLLWTNPIGMTQFLGRDESGWGFRVTKCVKFGQVDLKKGPKSGQVGLVLRVKNSGQFRVGLNGLDGLGRFIWPH